MPTLTGLLVAGIIAAPLSTIALFTPARQPRRVAGAWPALRRLTSALAGTAVLAGIVGAALLLLGVQAAIVARAAAALTVASLSWLPATRRWNARAHVAWAATVFLFVAYLVFILQWTLASHMSAFNTAGGLVLWLLEAAAAVLACAPRVLSSAHQRPASCRARGSHDAANQTTVRWASSPYWVCGWLPLGAGSARISPDAVSS